MIRDLTSYDLAFYRFALTDDPDLDQDLRSVPLTDRCSSGLRGGILELTEKLAVFLAV